MYITEFRNAGVSMFEPRMGLPMTNTQEQDISLFDVKDLYDRAYAIKDMAYNDSAHDFKDALAMAVKLDMQYRQQIAQENIERFSPALDKHRESVSRAA